MLPFIVIMLSAKSMQILDNNQWARSMYTIQNYKLFNIFFRMLLFCISFKSDRSSSLSAAIDLIRMIENGIKCWTRCTKKKMEKNRMNFEHWPSDELFDGHFGDLMLLSICYLFWFKWNNNITLQIYTHTLRHSPVSNIPIELISIFNTDFSSII